jgi:flagellar hook-length control protein FliK
VGFLIQPLVIGNLLPNSSKKISEKSLSENLKFRDIMFDSFEEKSDMEVILPFNPLLLSQIAIDVDTSKQEKMTPDNLEKGSNKENPSTLLKANEIKSPIPPNQQSLIQELSSNLKQVKEAPKVMSLEKLNPQKQNDTFLRLATNFVDAPENQLVRSLKETAGFQNVTTALPLQEQAFQTTTNTAITSGQKTTSGDPKLTVINLEGRIKKTTETVVDVEKLYELFHSLEETKPVADRGLTLKGLDTEGQTQKFEPRIVSQVKNLTDSTVINTTKVDINHIDTEQLGKKEISNQTMTNDGNDFTAIKSFSISNDTNTEQLAMKSKMENDVQTLIETEGKDSIEIRTSSISKEPLLHTNSSNQPSMFTSAQANLEPGVPLNQPSLRATHFKEDIEVFVKSTIKLQPMDDGLEASLTLNPKHLGKVDVKVFIVDGYVTADFLANTSHGKELLESNVQALRIALEAQGLQIDKINISQSQSGLLGSFSQKGDSQNGRNSNQQESRRKNEPMAVKQKEYSELGIDVHWVSQINTTV